MNFINNWSRAVALDAGETSCLLDLPDGEWRLTLSDAAGTRWEIIDADVVGGSATLIRAREGTADQEWPEGSVIYNALTAEVIEGMSSSGRSTLTGEGPPMGAPPSVGAQYIDTLTGIPFASVGAASASDWVIVGGRHYTQSIAFDGTGPLNAVAMDMHARHIEIGVGENPVDEAFLTLPALPMAVGVTGVRVRVEAFDINALCLDLSAILSPGDYVTIVAPAAVTASRAGDIIAIPVPLATTTGALLHFDIRRVDVNRLVLELDLSEMPPNSTS